MRFGSRAITALLALACGALACGSGGGGDTVTITTRSVFPQGFLPVRLANSSGSGDVVLRPDGDLYAVDAQSADVTSVSRKDGSVTTFANDVGGAGNALFSIAL